MAEFQPPEALPVADGSFGAVVHEQTGLKGTSKVKSAARSSGMAEDEHEFDIAKEEQRKGGWYLAWHCRHKDCDSRGDLTAPSRGRAYELLALLDDGHGELTDG